MANRFKFTKTTLLDLPIPEHGKRDTYYDTDTPKLALRVTAAGAKTFYVIKRAGSEIVWLKIGGFPDMTVEKARQAALTALSSFANNENPAEVRRAKKKEPTFAELFKEYGERHGIKKRSWAFADSSFSAHLPQLGAALRRSAGTRLVAWQFMHTRCKSCSLILFFLFMIFYIVVFIKSYFFAYFNLRVSPNRYRYN